MIPPQLLIGAAALSIIAGFAGGWTVRDWKADSEALEAADAAQAREDAARAAIWQRADKREADREANEQRLATDRVTIKEYYRNAPPVPDNCAAPDAIVGVLQRAVATANASALGQSVEAMPELGDPTVSPDR